MMPRLLRGPAALLLLALAACGSAAGPRPLVLKGVTVIDMAGGVPRPGMTVVIRDGRIEAVSSQASVPRRAQVVDARGKFLIPGLWDLHVHLWHAERQMPLFLANGVTGVRDMGGDFQKLF